MKTLNRLTSNARIVDMNKISKAVSLYWSKLFLYLLVWFHVKTGFPVGEIMALGMVIAYVIVRLTFWKGYYDTKRIRIFYS